MKLLTLIAGAALSVAATTAIAAPAGMSGGGVLVDGEGMTLYIFDKDAPGTSNCYDGCAASWPPFIAKSGASAEGNFSLVTRKDGAEQWAFKGMPLYYWAGDSAPGDVNGDGVGGVWHVLK
ncbi:hypothetical protein GYB14_15655 [bacterium]|uniref:COG4315 family predicted lipoprotein n=1 Tax=Salipiger bermudensis TaxID=344736 RepID=UPI000C8BCAAB|nr:hypothetical protein [Salipiger bermudensis]MAE88808.1 hypothetical protein [Pelagibaca sp.]MBR9893134.1 hypothetical protein [bacterium]MCA1286688.1 hypothetical protein [Salipiger bermudensis]